MREINLHQGFERLLREHVLLGQEPELQAEMSSRLAAYLLNESDIHSPEGRDRYMQSVGLIFTFDRPERDTPCFGSRFDHLTRDIDRARDAFVIYAARKALVISA